MQTNKPPTLFFNNEDEEEESYKVPVNPAPIEANSDMLVNAYKNS